MKKLLLKDETKPIIGFSLIVIIIFASIIKQNKDNHTKQESLKAYKYESIARVKKYITPLETNSVYEYEYFYNNVYYKNSYFADGGLGKRCEGKYYKMELSTENPKYANIFLNMEVTDTVKIKKAGFMCHSIKYLSK